MTVTAKIEEEMNTPAVKAAYDAKVSEAMHKAAEPVPTLHEVERALRPFADKAEYADALGLADDDYVECCPLLAGDYRRVRHLLAALSGATK